MATLTQVGRSVPRLEGQAKVTGTAEYVHNQRLPGMLYGPYWEKNKTTVYQYREGTLIIDIMDVASNQLVWRGWATDVISEKSLKDPEQAINNAVREIFKKFP